MSKPEVHNFIENKNDTVFGGYLPQERQVPIFRGDRTPGLKSFSEYSRQIILVFPDNFLGSLFVVPIGRKVYSPVYSWAIQATLGLLSRGGIANASSYVPLYPPRIFRILSLPVKALAARMAHMKDWDPPNVNHTFSTEGTLLHIISANASLPSSGMKETRPFGICS